MNAEQIEHELNNRRGAEVTVVRSGYGTQSDSWIGTLSVTHPDCPMVFQVQSPLSATIFRADDVLNVEEKRVGGNEWQFIIRLKGPNDYISLPVNA